MKAYRNDAFLNSPDARSLRILAEYLEPESRFEKLQLRDTIVFLGSARTPPREQAVADLEAAVAGRGDPRRGGTLVAMAGRSEEGRLGEQGNTLWGTDQ